MPAISVGSVEVDVLPNATGVRQRMQNQLVPAANQVGDEVGRIIGRYLTSHVASAFVQGVNRGGRNAQPAAARQGQSTGSTFGRSFKATLEAALAALPEVRLRANSTDAEREIYQVQNRSGQDPLNYPIRLNNKIAALAGVAASTDARPTNQTLEVFRILSGQLATQLGRIRSALNQSLPGLNRDLASASWPVLVESTLEVRSATPSVGGDSQSEEEGSQER